MFSPHLHRQVADAHVEERAPHRQGAAHAQARTAMTTPTVIETRRNGNRLK